MRNNITTNKSILPILVCLISFFSLLSCGEQDNGRIRVFASILPQKYFIERIGGEYVDTAVMVAPGMNPSTYDPLPGQMSALAVADAYFRIGVPFEDSWIGRIQANYPGLKIIDTRMNITLRHMDTFHALADSAGVDSLAVDAPVDSTAHSDHDKGDHTHDPGRPDPHIWLSPELVKIQSATICETLAVLAPEHEDEFRANLARFHEDLDRLSVDIADEIAALPNRTILVFHPSWGYFADQFGLTQVPVEIEGKEPGPARLAAIIQFAEAESIKTIIVQSQFSTTMAETIAREINGSVLQIDPLAENYIDNLRETAALIAAGQE